MVHFIQPDGVKGPTVASDPAVAARNRFDRCFAMSKIQPRNRLLAAMEPASLARITRHLEPVTLKLGDVVCEAGGLLEHAYFPRGAVLSLLTVLENGSAKLRTSGAKEPSGCSRPCTAASPSTDV